MTDDLQELITIEEAARRLSLSRTVIYRLMDQDELRYLRVGRARRIIAASIPEFVQRHSDGEVQRAEAVRIRRATRDEVKVIRAPRRCVRCGVGDQVDGTFLDDACLQDPQQQLETEAARTQQMMEPRKYVQVVHHWAGGWPRGS